MNSPVSNPAGDIFVAKITAVDSADANGYVAHYWQEQRFDPSSRAYLDHEFGRTGTPATSTRGGIWPAFDLNKGSLAVGSLVFMRIRGWSDISSSSSETCESGLVYDILGSASATPFSGAQYLAAPGDMNDSSYLFVNSDALASGGYDTIGVNVTGGYFNTSAADRLVVPFDGWYNFGAQTYSLSFGLPFVEALTLAVSVVGGTPRGSRVVQQSSVVLTDSLLSPATSMQTLLNCNGTAFLQKGCYVIAGVSYGPGVGSGTISFAATGSFWWLNLINRS